MRRRLLMLAAAAALAVAALPDPGWADLFVSSTLNSQVPRYDGTTGAFVSVFVPAGSGGLAGVRGLVFGPDGTLYVSSLTTNQILRYDGTTGAFLDVFVTAGSGGLASPRYLVFHSIAAPVPVLSPWGLIALCTLLAGVGAWALRRLRARPGV